LSATGVELAAIDIVMPPPDAGTDAIGVSEFGNSVGVFA
jgi:hypothetical protein